MTTIVLVSGSLRWASLNTAALATVRRILAERVPCAEFAVLNVGELPYYHFDVEQQDGSAAVRAARALVSSADALVISTPSYNGEMPGVLKNALDWLSRPHGGGALKDRVIALLSASPSPRGALEAQPALAGVLTRCGAHVVEHPPVAIGRATDLATTDGEFTDPALVASLESLVDALLASLDRRSDVLV